MQSKSCAKYVTSYVPKEKESIGWQIKFTSMNNTKIEWSKISIKTYSQERMIRIFILPRKEKYQY